MSRKVKGLIEKEFQSAFDGVTECVVVSVRGVKGVANNRLRGDLLSKDVHLKVVRNSLARRAFSALGAEGMGAVLKGPCAVAHGSESIVDLVKILESWDKEIEAFQIKGGYLDGEVLDAERTKALAKMPTRRELQGQLVQLALTPGGNVVSAATSPAGVIAGCLKTIIDKQEEGEAA